jgi:hypothetical protein
MRGISRSKKERNVQRQEKKSLENNAGKNQRLRNHAEISIA